MNDPRRFHLVRDTDVTGISGTGHVAAGVIWPDGTVCMRWLTYTASTSCYESIDDVETIHGHQGATYVRFMDGTESSVRSPGVRRAEGDTSIRVFRIMRPDADGDLSCVADGVEWSDCTVSVRWRGERASTVYWKSVNDAFAIHAHDGATEFHFPAAQAA